jgi:hypothetical protein
MSRFVRNGGLALLLLVFTACRDITGPQSVAQARVLWESHGLTSYSYFGTQTCFCTVPNGPVRVDVVNGSVSVVTDLTTHTQIPSTSWLTVDDLLDLAETLQPRVVEFDKNFGFPKRVERCCITDDSGSVYTVSAVVPT